jgi:formylglycine-generating enzyme required for sulfatase activity
MAITGFVTRAWRAGASGMLMLLVCAGHVCAQTAKTLIVRPAGGEFAGQTFYTNSHALVIGISEYGFLPKSKWLDYAAKDAAELREVLIRSYGFLPENVTVLLNEQATKANTEHALSALADDRRIKSDDRVLIFFSGHGQTVKSGNGGDMGFLIPYDAKVDLEHPENRGPYLDSCIPMDHIWSYVESSPAKHSLVIADACFGGLLIHGRALTPEKPSLSFIASQLSRRAQQVLTAGGKGEEAQEDPKLGHGYLTFKLLEELKAQAATPDSIILTSQLATHLKTSVANLSHAKQTPQFGNHNNTEGDFVFVTTAPQPVPQLGATAVAAREEQPTKAAVKMPQIDAKYGLELVEIPAGEFAMGSTEEEVNAILAFGSPIKREWIVGEKPQHTVYLDTYYIGKTPVTAGQYKQFCAATGYAMPPEPGGKVGIFDVPHFNPHWSKDDHPIVNVSWNDAVAYCKWLSKETGYAVSLPTEAQWEKAARGKDGRRYPWGPNWDDGSKCANSVAPNNLGSTMPVGSYPLGASPYGVLDMAGNVWQWCSDWFDAGYYQGSPDRNPTGPANGQYRVLRGGSWRNDSAIYFHSAVRYGVVPDGRGSLAGFRCVVRADTH